MRFAIPFTNRQSLRLTRSEGDWPMTLRVVYLVLPLAMLMLCLMLYVCFKTSEKSLYSSLEALPLIEAKVSAKQLGDSLAEVRNSLLKIAQYQDLSQKNILEQLPVLFHSNASLVSEISLKSTSGNNYYLLRNSDLIAQADISDASFGPYSPFQQITTRQLVGGQVTIYPAVSYSPSSVENINTNRQSAVVRMATPLPNGDGVLIIGVNLKEWQIQLADFMRLLSTTDDRPRGEGQLTYLFDSSGWILFEMDLANSNAFFPDKSRVGYTGDFGRPGYDAAFRPWPAYLDFWRGVTQTTSGRSGAIHLSGDLEFLPFMNRNGIVCHAPLMFAANANMEAQAIGGVAVFESSPLPSVAFVNAANISIVLIVMAVIFMGSVIYLSSRKMAQPLVSMVGQLKTMNAGLDYAAIELTPACREHHQLQTTVNNLISHTVSLQSSMERSKQAIIQAQSALPVDLSQITLNQSFYIEYDLVGSGKAIQEVRDKIQKAAKAGTDTLICGETGTGKELVAAAIHKAGQRADGPFISINCGALDENLLLDALFGHAKGAFSDAKSDRKGAFLSANDGTLHLDEIANASIKVQQSLLRALSVRRIRPLGTDQEIPFNTRVVSATNVNLIDKVKSGEFREDLYYRLAILNIETPPLRHRKEDIAELAAFCIYEQSQNSGRLLHRLSRGALDKLVQHDWPGNVREFKNCMSRAMAFAEGDMILSRHILIDTRYPLPNNDATPENYEHLAASDNSRADFSTVGNPQQAKDNGSHLNKKIIYTADTSSASDYLWPAPPRSLYTPAKVNGAVARTAESAATPILSAVPESNIAPLDSPDASRNVDSLPGQDLHANLSPGDGQINIADLDKKAYDLLFEFYREHVGRDKLSELNFRQRSGLLYAVQQGELNRSQYEELVNAQSTVSVSARTAQNDLKALVEDGFLMRIGAGPGTRYVIPHKDIPA